MSEEDGGPAFPRPVSGRGDDFDSGAVGMSLRDYFAAHAPAHPANWFEPVSPPRPEPEWPEGFGPRDGPALNADVVEAYDAERARQWSVQWPYAWADALLAQRAKAQP